MGGYVDHGWRHGPGGSDPAPIVGGSGATGTGAEMNIKVFKDTELVTTGDGKFVFAVPADLNGIDLIGAHAYISTASSSGVPTVQIRNITQAHDMLSTRVTIDVGDLTSFDPDFPPATPPVVNSSNATVAIGDLIAVDVDVAGTGSKGLGVILTWDSDPSGSGATGARGSVWTSGTGAPSAGTGVDGDFYLNDANGDVYKNTAGTWTLADNLTGPTGPGNIATDTLWDAKGDLAAATAADTAVRVPVGSNGQVLTADSAQTAGVKWAAAPTGQVVLYDNTLSASTANWDVSSISQAYTHLKIFLLVRGTAAAAQVLTQVRYNNDSSAIYDWQQLFGSVSTATANAASNVTLTRYGFTGGSTITSGLAGVAEITIPFYTGTTFDKPHIGTVWAPGPAGSPNFEISMGGRWRSASAINRITIFPDAGSWAAGSRLIIVGVV